MSNEIVAYRVEEHRTTRLAVSSGPGWYHAFDGSPDVMNGPFPTADAAHEDAIEALTVAVAEATFDALFGAKP
jgi:hypothetical protein